MQYMGVGGVNKALQFAVDEGAGEVAKNILATRGRSARADLGKFAYQRRGRYIDKNKSGI